LLDTGNFGGDGGHYILRPAAKLLQTNFINRKHEFDGTQNTLNQPIALPESTAVQDDVENGIEDGELLLS